MQQAGAAVVALTATFTTAGLRNISREGTHVHRFVDRVIRATRICGSWAMCNYAEIARGGFGVVGVAVASRFRQGHGAAGRELIERSISAVLGLIHAFGLRNGDKIVFHANYVDAALRRRTAGRLQLCKEKLIGGEND